MSSDRKALLRGSSDGPGMRNLPLFVFLAGLVFFFYLFYLHQSQSAEYAITQAELLDHKHQLKTLKLDILNAKADNERLKSSESLLREEVDKLTKERDKCSVSLRSAERDKQGLNEEIGKKSDQVNQLSAKLDAVNKEFTEYKKVIAAKEAAENAKKEISQKPADTGANAMAADGRLDSSAKNVLGNEGTVKQILGHNEYGQGGRVSAADRRREFKERGRAEAVEEKEDEQAPAPAPLNVEGEGKEMTRKSAEAESKKEELQAQVRQPPQHPGDRVKLAVALDEQQGREPVVDKPVVRGGDYEDKLDVEKGIGDDIQPA